MKQRYKMGLWRSPHCLLSASILGPRTVESLFIKSQAVVNDDELLRGFPSRLVGLRFGQPKGHARTGHSGRICGQGQDVREGDRVNACPRIDHSLRFIASPNVFGRWSVKSTCLKFRETG